MLRNFICFLVNFTNTCVIIWIRGLPHPGFLPEVLNDGIDAEFNAVKPILWVQVEKCTLEARIPQSITEIMLASWNLSLILLHFVKLSTQFWNIFKVHIFQCHSPSYNFSNELLSSSWSQNSGWKKTFPSSGKQESSVKELKVWTRKRETNKASGLSLGYWHWECRHP